MGNKSTKSSNKKKKFFCCLCTSYPSSCSINKNQYLTFNKISSNNNNNYDLTLLDNSKINHIQLTIKHNLINNDEQLENILKLKSNEEFIDLIKKFQLKFYLKDYLSRLKNSEIKQTFKNHFSSSIIIYPYNNHNQYLINDLNVFLINPPESILPNLLTNKNSLYEIHEQIRSKCYFIPFNNYQIEPYDNEYKRKSIEIDSNHVNIILENNPLIQTNQFKSTYIFKSNDSFQTGFICIHQEKIDKEFLPFIYHCSKENLSYLSSNLIQQWFNTLILVNQTCTIAKQFLTGNENYFTCLFKEQMNNQSLNKENSYSFSNTLTFAALRLPSCTYSINNEEKKSDQITNAFSPVFLSENFNHSNNLIYIDYEQYSFAFILSHWPKILIDNYYTHPNRYTKRQWPSEYEMNIIIKNSLLLIPNSTTHKWEINFSLIEEYLFKLMNESTLFFYILCQQLFSQTYSIRILIKHCFLNYCEKYGLPFSNKQNNIFNLINHFLNDLFEQIKNKFIPNYFNHQINLFNTNENYNQWFDYINQCIYNRIYLFSSSSCIIISNRSLIIEYLFFFIKQLYEIFHIKRSEFYLNDNILLNLHKQLCQKLTNETNNNYNKFINDLLNNKDIIENIQMNLIDNYEINSELVHIYLNQIRKAQPSLIFHNTWTIFIQYLHTYFNVLWNI